MVGLRIRVLFLSILLVPALAYPQISVEPGSEPKSEPKTVEKSTTSKKSTAKTSTAKDKVEKKKSDSKTQSNILFEGWHKVLSGGVQVGYFVQRYEFDQKKKEFRNTYYLRTNNLGGSVIESLKARSDSGLKPLAYQYTELVAGKAKTIDATFTKDLMTAVVTEAGKQPVTIKKNIPKGAFLSSFLVYMMLSAKEGISVGARYGYNGIAEEDAGVYPGEASVASNDVTEGIPTLKVFNTFKKTQFVSYITAKGEALSTRSPVQGIATELVATMEDAIKGQSYTPGSVKELFGDIPQGKLNPVSLKAASAPKVEKAEAKAATEENAAEPAEAKKEKIGDVPAGIGVDVKTSAPKKSKTQAEPETQQ